MTEDDIKAAEKRGYQRLNSQAGGFIARPVE